MKFCKDCKHRIVSGLMHTNVCHSPKLKRDLVTGDVHGFTCEYLRRYDWLDAWVFDKCGERGRWWEAKE